jgi:hypothetical protein
METVAFVFRGFTGSADNLESELIKVASIKGNAGEKYRKSNSILRKSFVYYEKEVSEFRNFLDIVEYFVDEFGGIDNIKGVIKNYNVDVVSCCVRLSEKEIETSALIISPDAMKIFLDIRCSLDVSCH